MEKKLIARAWMLIALVYCFAALTMTSCSKDDDVDPESELIIDGGEDQITDGLKKAPGVVRIRKDVRTTAQDPELVGCPVYFVYFKQLVDHNDASKGTFEQKVAITMSYPYNDDPENTTVLHTQGYNTPDKADEVWTTTFYGINYNEVQVEYRYFGTSLPEPFENLEFNYLSSEQASADLHVIVSALKQTGLFNGKWMSTGVSKSGITTALYAYYDELNNWNDIDVYVPFCAPFILGLDQTETSDYIENEIIKDLPTQKKWLFDLGRLLVDNTEKGETLREAVAKAYDEKSYNEMTDEEKAAFLCKTEYYYMTNLFARFSYYNIDLWKDLIPNPNEEDVDFEYLATFMKADSKEFDKLIDNYSKANTRAVAPEGERYLELLKKRKEDKTWPYYVQAVLELGTYDFGYNYLKNAPLIDQEDMMEWSKVNVSSEVDLPEYTPRYSNAMMKGFLGNLLNTKKKMVFVYGGNDPWTGAAIPDAATTNTNIKKFIVPHGTHDDDILTDKNWETVGPDIIMAINQFMY